MNRKQHRVQRDAEIREKARKGATNRKLQEEYHPSKESIHRIAGDLIPDPRLKQTADRNERICQKARKGAINRKLQQEYNLGYDSIQRIAGDIFRRRSNNHQDP